MAIFEILTSLFDWRTLVVAVEHNNSPLQDFICLKLANCLRENTERWRPLTTVAASHHHLPHPPLAETTIRWSWLVGVCLGAGWVAPRQSWG